MPLLLEKDLPDNNSQASATAKDARPQPLIHLHKVSKVYQTGDFELFALDDVSLQIFPGEYVAIVGSSGSGKSTLMNIVGLLDEATSGAYFFQGQDTQRLSQSKQARLRNHAIGFVFQHFHLLPKVRARRQVELPLVYGARRMFRKRSTVVQLLTHVGLGKHINHLPEQLSGGQKQRVAIARALINQPRLLLADEPTGALDTKTSQEILTLFEQIRAQSKLTVVLVTHDPEVARRTDRVITMMDGKIIEDRRNRR